MYSTCPTCKRRTQGDCYYCRMVRTSERNAAIRAKYEQDVAPAVQDETNKGDDR